MRSTQSFLFSAFISCGFILLLADIPGELLHREFGPAKYLLDAALIVYFCALLVFLFLKREINHLLSRSWPLLILFFLALPMPLNLNHLEGERLADLVIPLKWYFLWFYALALGYAFYFVADFSRVAILLLSLFYLLLSVDTAIGFYELHSGDFFFSGSNYDETALGVRESKFKQVEGAPRIKALDRDVFSFANLLGSGVVLTLALLLYSPFRPLKIFLFCFLPPLAYMLFNSGGRSALFGIALSVMTFFLLLFSGKILRLYPYVLPLFFLTLLIIVSCFGIGKLTVFLGENLMPQHRLANPENAFERDELWKSIEESFVQFPQILIAGAPMAALFFDREFPPRLDYADNQLLWLLYHLGIFGTFLLFYFFGSVLFLSRRKKATPWAFGALLLFLAFVCGESMARDALFFNGSLFLFIFSGYLLASTSASAPQQKHRSGRRPAFL